MSSSSMANTKALQKQMYHLRRTTLSTSVAILLLLFTTCRHDKNSNSRIGSVHANTFIKHPCSFQTTLSSSSHTATTTSAVDARATSTAFILQQHRSNRILKKQDTMAIRRRIRSNTSPEGGTALYMVFDFFRDRTKEGFDQLQNLGTMAARGQLTQGLQDIATYTQQTNQAFAMGLAKSRNRLLNDIEALFTGISTEDMIEELQDILLQADIGAVTAEEIVQEVKSLREDSTTRLSQEDLKSIMRGKLIEALDVGPSRSIRFQPKPDENDIIQPKLHIPTVLFIMGANGMGKTTTIGKLAHRLRTEGNQTVLLAACDTFRAGAVEQLQMWADRANVTMIGPNREGMKPSAVLFEALTQGISDKVDTVIVDTSGRLSNNDALTQELVKMKKVIQTRLSSDVDPTTNKPIPNLNVPHETLLVIDAAQGRMALDSAKVWDESLGLTGLILTKLDGSARGGSVVAVSRDIRLPVKLIGVGEGINDLRDFDPAIFVDGLLGIGAAGGNNARSNEGAMLASRLAEMRQERDARSKIRKETTASTGTAVMASAATTVAAPRVPLQPKPNRPGKKKGKK